MSDDLFGVLALVLIILATIGTISIFTAYGILPPSDNGSVAFLVLPWWAYIIAIVAITEFLFIVVDDDKPSKKSHIFKHTIGHKALWLAFSALVVAAVQGIAVITYLIFPFIYENFYTGLQAIGVIAAIIIAGYLYIKLNTLKYRKTKYKTKKKEAKA